MNALPGFRLTGYRRYVMRALEWIVELIVWLCSPYTEKRDMKSYRVFRQAIKERYEKEGLRIRKEYS